MLAVEQTPTRVGAWAGTVMWSRWVPASRSYALVKSVDGRAALRVGVPPRRKAPFDIDLGTGPSDEIYAVYTRRGDIYRLDVQTGKETKLDGLSSKAEEREPSIMDGRVAFVRNDRLWMGDMSGAAPRRLGRHRFVQTTEMGVGHIAYVENVSTTFGTDRVRIHNVSTGADQGIYDAESGGANAAGVTRPTYVAGGFLWARTNLGSGKGNRIIRYYVHGSGLTYAQGSPDYGSTAWAGRALGVATARSHDHIDDASPGVVEYACGYEHERSCRVELTGQLKYGIDPDE